MGPNSDSIISMIRSQSEGGGEDLSLAGLVGASDGLIDLGNPQVEIDENAKPEDETRTTEWDENVI